MVAGSGLSREEEHAMSSTDDLVELESADGFAPTLERVAKAIESHGMTIFARVDHAAGARSVGLAMPPTIVLLYGNPKGGTPLMLAAPQAALDLPLHVVVRENENGKGVVAFHPAAPLMKRAGVPDALAGKLDPAQAILTEAVKR
jgi:uncharacterized protein (DUF302 family)